MFSGNVAGAIRLLSGSTCDGTLPLDHVMGSKTVKDILLEKHPKAQPPSSTIYTVLFVGISSHHFWVLFTGFDLLLCPQEWWFSWSLRIGCCGVEVSVYLSLILKCAWGAIVGLTVAVRHRRSLVYWLGSASLVVRVLVSCNLKRLVDAVLIHDMQLHVRHTTAGV